MTETTTEGKETTTEGDDLKFVSYSIVTAMIVMDAATVLLLTFDYVVPVVVAFPELEVVQALSALGILVFLLSIQAFFLPVIAFLLDFSRE